MEVIITVIICITIVIIAGIWQFGRYLRQHGPLDAWKKANFEAVVSNHANDGRITLITPRGRAGAKHVKIELMEDLSKNMVEVKMMGYFDRDSFQECI